MSKLRCDSHWNKLNPDQKNTLHQWLFEQNLGYERVCQLAYEHFGLQASTSSVGRYYRAMARRQLRDDMRETGDTVAVADSTAVDVASMRSATVKLVGKRVMDAALQPNSVKSSELSSLASVLLASEQQQIQRGWLDLAREKFRFNAIETARKLVPTLNEMTEEDNEREQWRAHRMMRAAFGDACDLIRYPEGHGPGIGSKAWAELHSKPKPAPPQSTQVLENSPKDA